MPWNDQNGGGGGGPWGSGGSGGGDKNGSPWGRPQNGDGKQNGDLEDQFRKMQDRFKGRFGGGSGGSSGGGGKGLGAVGFGLLAIVLLLAWLATGIVRVDAGEQAVIFQFGKWERNIGSGLSFHMPYPIETHKIIDVETQRSLSIGETQEERMMLTQDESIADIRFSVFWKVKTESPQEYILNVKDPEGTVRLVSESVMREVVGKSDLQLLITEERAQVAEEVQQQVQALLDEYGAGISINDVQITKGDPPAEVIQAFNNVTEAEQQAVTLRNQANQYANRIVPDARGEAAQIVQDAEAYRERVIADAKGQASRFDQILEEYRKAPRVTRERMYLETMERVLRNTDKLILDNDSGAVPYLPIDRTNRSGNN